LRIRYALATLATLVLPFALSQAVGSGWLILAGVWLTGIPILLNLAERDLAGQSLNEAQGQQKQ
jgi:hypothetical protein